MPQVWGGMIGHGAGLIIPSVSEAKPFLKGPWGSSPYKERIADDHPLPHLLTTAFLKPEEGAGRYRGHPRN